jgi:hypothetical protein
MPISQLRPFEAAAGMIKILARRSGGADEKDPGLFRR